MQKTLILTLGQAADLLWQGETIMVKEFAAKASSKSFFHAFSLSHIEGREAIKKEQLLDYLNSYYEKFEYWK